MLLSFKYPAYVAAFTMVLGKLKEILGIGESSGGEAREDTEVTVERETSTDDTGIVGDEPADETVDADETLGDADIGDEESADDEDVETIGDEDAGTVGDEEAEPAVESGEDDGDGAAAEPTDAAASTGSMTEEPPDEPAGAAEPAEATGPESDDVSVSDEDDESVDQINGIGSAYSDRLAEAGIETVAQLAAADPAEIAEQTSVGESRAQTWIDRAKEF